ncbi:hypothetical protein DFH09DRAFT_1091746 [Mycena vulgaris]|nr:hypothetical protein DFH09DRAFT_1091746 [Mycena vulgaris]
MWWLQMRVITPMVKRHWAESFRRFNAAATALTHGDCVSTQTDGAVLAQSQTERDQHTFGELLSINIYVGQSQSSSHREFPRETEIWGIVELGPEPLVHFNMNVEE